MLSIAEEPSHIHDHTIERLDAEPRGGQWANAIRRVVAEVNGGVEERPRCRELSETDRFE